MKKIGFFSILLTVLAQGYFQTAQATLVINAPIAASASSTFTGSQYVVNNLFDYTVTEADIGQNGRYLCRNYWKYLHPVW
jgi:ABC-type enterochelin transport system permease subunit